MEIKLCEKLYLADVEYNTLITARDLLRMIKCHSKGNLSQRASYAINALDCVLEFERSEWEGHD